MPSSSVPDRVAWAVDQLDLHPNARVLEIGGGPGAAAELICRRLDDGSLVGIDRSAVAMARSAKRNEAHVDAGRLELRQGALADLVVPDDSFDLAFCINVNLFWTGPAHRELDLLHRALRPGGSLHVLYGPGPGDPTDALATVRQQIEASARSAGPGYGVRVAGGSEIRATKM